MIATYVQAMGKIVPSMVIQVPVSYTHLSFVKINNGTLFLLLFS